MLDTYSVTYLIAIDDLEERGRGEGARHGCLEYASHEGQKVPCLELHPSHLSQCAFLPKLTATQLVIRGRSLAMDLRGLKVRIVPV